MRAGFPTSLTIHIAILIVMLFGLPHSKPLEAPPVEAIAVDIAPLGDTTKTTQGKKTAPPKETPAMDKVTPPKERPDSTKIGATEKDQETPVTPQASKTAAAESANQPPPPPPKQAPPEPKPEPPKPEPPKVDPPPQPPKVEPPKPEPPKPDTPKATPAKDTAALSDLIAKETAEAAKAADAKPADKTPDQPQDTPPVPTVRPKVKPTPPKPDAVASDTPTKPDKTDNTKPTTDTAKSDTKPKFDPDQLSALLNKVTPSGGGGKASTQDASLGANTPTPAASLSIDDIDLLKRQIKRCWTPPLGATAADNLKVKVEFKLNEDGDLMGEPVVVEKPNGDFADVAADAAQSAIAGCAPYSMPPEKYALWKSIRINFDPRDMF